MRSVGCPACSCIESELIAENPKHTLNAGASQFVNHVRNVLCRDCGLIYNEPMPSEQELTALYEAIARDVPAREPTEPPPVLEIEKSQSAFVCGWLGGRTGWSVLDVGCSMGGFLAAVAESGARVVGCEPSPFDAAVARSRGLGTVREGFFEQLDFGAERFDVVALRFVFEHVRHPRAILRRAARLLEPGGAIFLEVPNLERPFIGFDDFFSYGHLQTFVPETLAAVCGREGLSVLALEASTNIFDSAPHPPSIRALVVKSPGTSVAGVDVARVRALAARYHGEREAFVEAASRRLNAATRGRRTVVYGAGTHTAEMWARCPFLESRVVALVDGNPRLQGHNFLGRAVYPRRDLPRLDPEVIVVSVRTAEAPIRRILADQGYGAQTLTIYDAAPAGVS